MADQHIEARRVAPWKPLGLAAILIAVLIWPGPAWSTVQFVIWGLVVVAPVVAPGIALSAWVIASGADAHIAAAFEGRVAWSVFAATAIGAITPVCGVTVLPLMAGLLAAGVPLAPVMAFWLASPVTDPAMLATTAATLGLSFAIGKTLAAFGLGLLGGVVTAQFGKFGWAQSPLRRNRLVGQIIAARCDCGQQEFQARFWQDDVRRAMFRAQAKATTRLILICLIPAFAAEYWLNELLQPAALTAYLGEDSWYAIPLAVTVGAPAYLDGYAALPLTRGLMDHGMSPGAAMGFLVSGGVVSIWGAMAIAPVLRMAPFLLYLGLAVSGSLAVAYVFEWVM